MLLSCNKCGKTVIINPNGHTIVGCEHHPVYNPKDDIYNLTGNDNPWGNIFGGAGGVCVPK